MNFRKLLISSTICSAIAVMSPFTAFAEEAVPINIEKNNIISVVSSDNGLATPLTPGLHVISYNNPLIISGKTGEKIKFSADIFDEHEGYVPSSVQILSLPNEESGTLMYNSSSAGVGQSVSVLSLNSLYFAPESAEDAEFVFSTDNSTLKRCVIRQKDSKNTPPAAYGEESITTYTKLNAPVGGYMNGTDNDGDDISFEIVKYPSKGILSVKNSETGFYTYHPYSGMSGSDSFSYRIRDSYGAYSETYTSQISVENKSAIVYDDTKDSFYTSAVTDVISTGIMHTHKTQNGELFLPDEPVSRIDFLIMAMKTMGAGEADKMSSSPFADDSTLSKTEKGYLTAAYNLGIIKGSYSDEKLVFMPDEAIDGASAATILNGILGLSGTGEISVSALGDDVPAWAVPSLSALTNAGIIDRHTAPASEILTRENVAVILSGILKKLA